MKNFEHTIRTLHHEISRLTMENGRTDYRIKELEAAIEILTEGKGYLRRNWPIAIRFFNDL